MYIDSHCHLDRVDLRHYGGDFARLMEATVESGVSHLLCVGIDLESYPAMRALVDPYPDVAVSVGVHPNTESDDLEVAGSTVDVLIALAADPRVVAIGETGLDYFHGRGDLGPQRERFRTQIAAAHACGKPLIVHTRDAREDTISILREERAEDIGGVLHCFTEDWDMARQGLDLGFYVSFSGIVTFKNAADLREVARRVPLDRLLIETDSPYLAPVPYRGKPNEPRHVAHVAACIAALRGLSVEELASVTAANYFRLFGGQGARARLSPGGPGAGPRAARRPQFIPAAVA
jgi:TatD DNase family protein